MVYVLTVFKNSHWGLRDPNNKMQYIETKVYKSKTSAENYINKFFESKTRLKINPDTKCFEVHNKYIELIQK